MGTLQVGGTTLGVKNTTTNKVDLSNTGTLDSLPFYACRAWVNFDGGVTSSANPLSFTNTNATNHGDANSAGETLCAIRGSGNVSKVVRNGTGDYTITFTTAMPDVNYAFSGSIKPETSQDADGTVIEDRDASASRTTSSLTIVTKEFSSDFTNPSIVNLIVIR